MEIDYVGSELELFRDAGNWKRYFASILKPHTGSRVLEVGAGIGGTTAVLCDDTHSDWCCLEPDRDQAAALSHAIETGDLPTSCRVVTGTVGDLSGEPCFDTILYIDVLEHIENDRAELRRAAQYLSPGGRLIVLAPAHQWLFSPFDAAVGHFRRYNVRQLAALTPPGLVLGKSYYLDACGILLSAANRLLLRRSMPCKSNIRSWDRFFVPLSRLLDRLTLYRLGKSVLVVWRRP